MSKILLISFSLFLLSCHCDCSKSFRSELWKKNPDFRYLLVDDLLASRNIKKLNTQGLIKLLGEPERRKKPYMIYKLGIKNDGRIMDREPAWLVIELNSDLIVAYSVTKSRPF